MKQQGGNIMGIGIMDRNIQEILDSFVTGWVFSRRGFLKEHHEQNGIHYVKFLHGTNYHEEFIYTSKELITAQTQIQHSMQDQPHWVSVVSPDSFDLDTLLQQGYQYQYPEILMELDLHLYEPIELPKYHCRLIQNPQEIETLNKAFQETVFDLESMQQAGLYTYVVEINREPIAHGRFSIIEEEAFLFNIFTRESFRGQGVAKSLCLRMLLDAKRLGMRRSYLMSNELGHRLYRSLGYRDLARVYVCKKG